MTDRPIIFNAAMIRALLDGRKSQTRQPLSRKDWTVLGEQWAPNSPWDGLRFSEAVVRDKSPLSGARDPHLAVPFCHPLDEPCPSDECGIYRVRPLLKVGDRWWVREQWGHDGPDLDTVRRGVESDGMSYGPYYTADADWFNNATVKRRSAINMPRWASRLTLTVTEARVQRVQDISEEDAIAEGVEPLSYERETWDETVCPACGGRGVHGALGANLGYTEVDCLHCDTHKKRFRNLWNSIYGPDAWYRNDWVAAYTFTVERRNIDAESAP